MKLLHLQGSEPPASGDNYTSQPLLLRCKNAGLTSYTFAQKNDENGQ